MSSIVAVNVHTHSITYVTNKLLTSLKNIIRLSGLNPEKLTQDWPVLERGLNRWLETEHLQEVHLEVFEPKTSKLIGRWDFEIFYGYTGDGGFWLDSDIIKYHIGKAGVCPANCEYRIVVTTKPGRPDVEGWSNTTLRSTDGFVKQSIGTTIDANGLRASSGYWRKVS
jgi:hypothetical protein